MNGIKSSCTMNCCSEACKASLCMQHVWGLCLRPPTQWAGSQCNMGFAAQHAIPGSAGSHLRWQMQVRLWCPSGATSGVLQIPSSGMRDFGVLTVWDSRCWIVGCYSTTKFAKAHTPIWLTCWEEFQHVSRCIYLHNLKVVLMQGAMIIYIMHYFIHKSCKRMPLEFSFRDKYWNVSIHTN